MKKITCLIIVLLFVAVVHAGEVRTWTSGKFTTEAEFVRISEDDKTVTLRKTDGKEINIAWQKLSEADRKYVEQNTRSTVSPENAPQKASTEYTSASINVYAADPAKVTVSLKTKDGKTEKINATELVVDNEALFKLLTDAMGRRHKQLLDRRLAIRKIILDAEKTLDVAEKMMQDRGYYVPDDGSEPFLVSGRGPNPILINPWRDAQKKIKNQAKPLERIEAELEVLRDGDDLFDYFHAKFLATHFALPPDSYVTARIRGEDFSDPNQVTVILRKSDGIPEQIKATELTAEHKDSLPNLTNAISTKRHQLTLEKEQCLQLITYAEEQIEACRSDVRKAGYARAALYRRVLENAQSQLNNSTQTLKQVVTQINSMDEGTLLNYFTYKLQPEKANVHAKDRNGRTPLHWAALERANIEIVQELLRKGANVNAKDERWFTPLHFAFRAETLELLLSKGADVNAKSGEGVTPLHAFVMGEYVEIAKLLLSNGADVNAKAANDTTPLNVAIEKENAEVVKLLLSNGADVHAKGVDDATPLHFASAKNNVEVIALLLSNGADVHAKSKAGLTPLHVSANVKVAKLLLSNGADVNAKDKSGRIPLHISANVGVIELLLSNGADVNAKEEENWTPLYCAVDNENVEVVKILLSNGADVNAKGEDGLTPLYVAIDKGNIEVAQLLLSNGADVNARIIGDGTPLHFAIAKENIAVAKLLLANGADVNARDSEGTTPLDLARAKGIDL